MGASSLPLGLPRHFVFLPRPGSRANVGFFRWRSPGSWWWQLCWGNKRMCLSRCLESPVDRELPRWLDFHQHILMENFGQRNPKVFAERVITQIMSDAGNTELTIAVHTDAVIPFSAQWPCLNMWTCQDQRDSLNFSELVMLQPC